MNIKFRKRKKPYFIPFKIVEVITDFKEICGGSVVSLVKLNDFRNVYQNK